jgi:hypothetical protein
LNRFSETAVSNLELVMRNALTAGIAAQSLMHRTRASMVFQCCWSDSGQIDFHDPTVVGAVDIGGGTPQTTRKAADGDRRESWK